MVENDGFSQPIRPPRFLSKRNINRVYLFHFFLSWPRGKKIVSTVIGEEEEKLVGSDDSTLSFIRKNSLLDGSQKAERGGGS